MEVLYVVCSIVLLFLQLLILFDLISSILVCKKANSCIWRIAFIFLIIAFWIIEILIEQQLKQNVIFSMIILWTWICVEVISIIKWIKKKIRERRIKKILQLFCEYEEYAQKDEDTK